MPATDPSRGTSSPGHARKATVLVRAAVVIVALVAGGYLFRQGELSKHLADPAPAAPPRSGRALPSASAANPSRTARAQASPTPTAAATPIPPVATAPAAPLPPVATAPAIVQAIDTSDPAPPSGYTRENFTAAQLGTAAGFAIARPPGWQSVPSPQQVTLEGPDGSYVEVDLSRHVTSDMVAEARRLQAARSHDFPGYQRIYSPPDQPLKKFIQPETIHRTLGALWEFDWVMPGNIQLREDVLLFDLGRQSYTIYAAGPAGKDDNNWNLATLRTVAAMLHTFQAVSS